MTKIVNVIGAGLAGCEAVHQLTRKNIKVRLYEMRPEKSTGAHHTGYFSELVCSNSLRSNALTNAAGLLKEEMRMLDSLIIKTADRHSVPAGSALAVDRENFSKEITETIRNNPLVEVINQEITEIPEGPAIIATGPLTSAKLAKTIGEYLKQDALYFFDAAAPIITKDSIDMDIAYYKSRYDKGSADYINCPFTKEQFDRFYNELIRGEKAQGHAVDKEVFFEGCMPIEVMAARGPQTLTFGPLKPVGLQKEGKPRPYAVAQLRQDNAIDTLYNLVGFQTNLKWGEQKRIFSLIPGLENCEIVRYGVMHRNTYLRSPLVLKETYQCRFRDDLFFAGQLTGVEGYVESAASGLIAGHNMALYLLGKDPVRMPNTTMIGALSYYITQSAENFQPMNANFGIFNLLAEVRKSERKQAYSRQSLAIIKEYSEEW
ncbi:MAG TPA: methylenetetrahydrofolate--tRNA-(uracil(54)-C(5))-methyltransferase (FADH(2)-oxidizing) TrmFO [Erysipelotrichaceae bacterium]|nr:methylenetetrahydrofolate--tRNA-(uracil(54)-C(5))-methyltransferase (FADH(2)-oxidizing) TrmFO [Erysipelotrichaceae bacterium]HQB32386.1 methylenetetrahydrofolate--tRNA-(uracil(54)-C(5))-methyltransferase (FADH(2)-oxidizing) TrmFO [Erysipelotrichaceae bacterium]